MFNQSPGFAGALINLLLFMRFILILTTLLINITLFSQNNYNINLPKVNYPTDTLQIGTHYTFHITKNREIYFNNERLRFWDLIASKILEQERAPNFNAVEHIVIYADADVVYSVIERLNQEIGRVWSGLVHYKCNGFNNKEVLTYYKSGSFLEPIKRDEFSIYYSDIIFTEKEWYGEEKVPNLYGFKSYYPAFWQHNFAIDFYRKDTFYINSSLSRLKYSSIKFTAPSKFDSKDEKIKSNAKIPLNEILQKNDVLFINFDYNFTFGQAMEVLADIQSQRKYGFNHETLRKPFLIEVPSYFIEDIKGLGLNIFSD